MKRSIKNTLKQVQEVGSLAQPSDKLSDSVKALLSAGLICERRTFVKANRNMTEFGITNEGKAVLKS